MRRDFSANVSHELKTPLTTIRGFAEMLGGGMITDGDDIRRYGKRIYDEANRLLNVINDIIRLSEIEEITRKFSPRPTFQLLQKRSPKISPKRQSVWK